MVYFLKWHQYQILQTASYIFCIQQLFCLGPHLPVPHCYPNPKANTHAPTHSSHFLSSKQNVMFLCLWYTIPFAFLKEDITWQNTITYKKLIHFSVVLLTPAPPSWKNLKIPVSALWYLRYYVSFWNINKRTEEACLKQVRQFL